MATGRLFTPSSIYFLYLTYEGRLALKNSDFYVSKFIGIRVAR